ncbi:MAG TPA: NAD-dependent epimerase/dehydratase family protein [Bosea sp. (in: a-proteobacteria)]|uniref:NAD-dependent epimerase/dehydratase family protein n=1 Tax=Bosea sp. (in: a-proteobacteria) TaxID=1871050 RepID=UPI002DDD381B|nr:NAD-dependent epimerase/dehydratase family protein [Bosea sp. (in: a-proteobacteria)]HEV2552965.1 NAD-dependent epimerase/dehydratase family protein [Bosea sp. (in: a-proteobacteria)]
MSETRSVMVTGGAGYVGSVLVPRLLAQGHKVTVLDLFLYGHDVFDSVRGHPNLVQVVGDIRSADAVAKAMTGCDTVIHLACISNDPSYELDPDLGRSINYDCFRPLVKAAKKAGVNRFIYASSSSVYGIKEEEEVTEDLSMEPLTDYSKFKALCEDILEEEREPGFTTLTIRPATVCGYGPRQRLDVIVNILTNHAVNNRKIKVLGGEQTRPNIHIDDMCSVYELALSAPAEKIDGKIYNAGGDNETVNSLAQMVKRVVEQDNVYGGEIELVVEPTNDNRSYRVSSKKIAAELGWYPQKTIEDAVRDLLAAFKDGRLKDTMTDERYFNIKTMQSVKLT